MNNKPRLKEFENKCIKLKYKSKVGYTNIIHGILTFVGKDSIIVIGHGEHVVKRHSIISWDEVKPYNKKRATEKNK